MKNLPKIFIIASLFATVQFMSSCANSGQLADGKSGAQLWGENCTRCHNAPSPETFSDHDWDVAVMHMRMRANLTEHEAISIADFLKTAN
jgi:cytochrome c5